MLMARADPRPGEHVVHIGAGVGYYSAILAHMVGESGQVTAIEYDPNLAARLVANFVGQANVRTVHGDGTKIDFNPADVIYVNAGVTRPLDLWARPALGWREADPGADQGQGRGRRVVPHRATRRRVPRQVDFRGRSLPVRGRARCRVERALVAALEKGGWERVTRLHRRGDVPEEQCWLAGLDWCLAYD